MKTCYVIGKVYSKHDYMLMLYANLPSGCKVEITENPRRVKVSCDVWKNKEAYVGPSYSNEFSHEEILKEQCVNILKKFGVDAKELWTW